jgi:hypothetical protein
MAQKHVISASPENISWSSATSTFEQCKHKAEMKSTRQCQGMHGLFNKHHVENHEVLEREPWSDICIGAFRRYKSNICSFIGFFVHSFEWFHFIYCAAVRYYRPFRQVGYHLDHCLLTTHFHLFQRRHIKDNLPTISSTREYLSWLYSILSLLRLPFHSSWPQFAKAGVPQRALCSHKLPT